MKLAAAVVAALALVPAAQAAPGMVAYVQDGTLYAYERGHAVRLARGALGDVSVAYDGGSVAYVRRGGQIAVAGARGGPSHEVGPRGAGFPDLGAPGRLLFVRGGAVEELDLSRGRRSVLDDGPVSGRAFRVSGQTLAARGGDLYLGATPLTRTRRREVALDYEADVGLLAAAGRELRAYQLGGPSRTLVRRQVRDAAWSPGGAEIAYVDAGGVLRIRTLVAGKERIIARGVTALDW